MVIGSLLRTAVLKIRLLAPAVLADAAAANAPRRLRSVWPSCCRDATSPDLVALASGQRRHVRGVRTGGRHGIRPHATGHVPDQTPDQSRSPERMSVLASPDYA